MKKRLILSLSILLIVAMSAVGLVGCGGVPNDFKAFIKPVARTTEIINIKELAVPTVDYGIVSGQNCRFALALKHKTNADDYALFNVETGAMVKSKKPFNFYSVFGDGVELWFNEVIVNASSTYNIVDCEGKVLFNLSQNDLNNGEIKNITSQQKFDTKVLKYKNTVCYVKDGKLIGSSNDTLNKSLFTIATEPKVKTVFGKDVIMQSNGPILSFYNAKDFTFEKSIDLSSFKKSDSTVNYFGLLNNKNIVVQVIEQLPEDAKKYQMMYFGFKTNLKTYVLDVNTGESKEVKFDYFFTGGAIANEQTMNEKYNSNYENYACLSKLGDKAIKTAQKTVAFDNDLKVLYESDSKFDNLSLTSQIGDDMYLFSDNFSGNSAIVNTNSGSIAPIKYNNQLTNIIYGVGVRYGNDILDFIGGYKFKLNATDKFIGAIGNVTFFSREFDVINEQGIVVSKRTAVFRKVGGEVETEIIDYSDESFNNGIYLTYNKTTEITKIFNAVTGAEMFASNKADFNKISLNDSSFCFVANGKVYIVTKTIA